MRYNSLLIILSVVITILLLELGLRVLIPVYSNQPNPVKANRHLYDAYAGHKLNPEFSTKNNTEGKSIHSSDGFRNDSPISINKPDNVIRIVALGASTLYGLGTWGGPYPNSRDLFNDETITFFLQNRLNKQLAAAGEPYRVEIINAAVIAYHTFQQLIRLNERLLDYQPDIVINIEGHNDFYIVDPAYRHWRDYPYSSTALMDEVNDRSFLAAAHFFIRSAAEWSALAAQVEKRVTLPLFNARLESRRTQLKPPTPKYANFEDSYLTTARKTYIRSLWQITQLGELEGYSHMVFLQPEIVFEPEANLSAHDRLIQGITKKHMKDPQLPSVIKQMLPTIFAEYNIPFTDVATISSSKGAKQDLYLDYCHLSAQGSKEFANNILPTLYAMTLQQIEKRKTLIREQ